MEIDQEYTVARNALIPEAEAFANREEGKFPPKKGLKRETWYGDWTLTFLRKMDSLAREMGLVA